MSFFGKPNLEIVPVINSYMSSAHWRFLYFHGQKNARLVCDQTAYDTPKRKRTALISFLSPLLFFGAEVHRKEMEKLWTDEVIVARAWNRFMTKTISEWNDLILWVRSHVWL